MKTSVIPLQKPQKQFRIGLGLFYLFFSPNIYKEARKTTVPYCNTAPIMYPLTPYRSPMLGPVWAFPHATPYCFRLFHATTRSRLYSYQVSNYKSVLLHLYVLFIEKSKPSTAKIIH